VAVVLDGRQLPDFIGSCYGYMGPDLLITAPAAILRERSNARSLLVDGSGRWENSAA